MRAAAATSVALAVALAGCGASSEPPAASTPAASTATASPAARTPTPTPSATVTAHGPRTPVTFRKVDEPGGALYIEGAVQFVKVDGHAFRLADGDTARTLRGGTHVIASYARPCDGNCDNLDAPEDGCRRRVTVRGPLTVTVHAKPGSPCRIDAAP